MGISHGFLSMVYDLLDGIYFRNGGDNPRQRIVDLVPAGRVKVLEICVGTGANALLIAKNRGSADVLGIDLSEGMLGVARKKIAKSGLKNIGVQRGDATAIDARDGSFDIALISLVLHEIPMDAQRRILAEAFRVLTRDGKLIVMEWAEPAGTERLLFPTIAMLEPKGFRDFLRMDMDRYFTESGFSVLRRIRCRYSAVYELKKNEAKKRKS